MPARRRCILIVLPGMTSLGREMGERCNCCSLTVARTDSTHARTHACIPHAGFARLSLARLSLINLFGRTIVRNTAGNPIGWKGPTIHRTGGCIAIKGEQPSCPRELVLCVFRLSHLISPPTIEGISFARSRNVKSKEERKKDVARS